MLCLGIESSCDDTGLALVEEGRLIDSVLASQTDAHAIFGGVVPELASREHCRYIGPLFDLLLRRAQIRSGQIDLIAVTRGPGLLGSLLVGCAFAKALALGLKKPLLGLNHLHAHLLSAGMSSELTLPALGLVVSGGHTELYRIDAPDRIKRLGRTLDDAAGEVFDKAGNFCGLPYPAGRRIDELGRSGEMGPISLPLPYLKNDNLDFSFSGIKTAAINYAAEHGINQESDRLADFCAALNGAIAETLAIKAERALALNPDLETLCLAGGVAANSAVRQKLSGLMRKRGGRMIVPEPELCADNGAMVAYAGWLLGAQGYRHGLDLEAIPRGRRIPEDMARL